MHWEQNVCVASVTWLNFGSPSMVHWTTKPHTYSTDNRTRSEGGHDLSEERPEICNKLQRRTRNCITKKIQQTTKSQGDSSFDTIFFWTRQDVLQTVLWVQASYQLKLSDFYFFFSAHKGTSQGGKGPHNHRVTKHWPYFHSLNNIVLCQINVWGWDENTFPL